MFIKKDSPGYQSYSRGCPAQYKKQPIILTDQEKEYIDARDRENGTKSYDESIRYGTGEEKYNYICPRFWCIRDENGKGRSLSLKQINDGECGGWDALVPEGAKKVPKGKRIVEFTEERFHRENAKNTKKGDPARKLIYRPMYPGFQDPNKHPKGLCVPCCFQAPTKKIYEDYFDESGNHKYKILETGEIVDEPPKIQGMYKPRPLPTFDTDSNGNIIMDSIKGEMYTRPNGEPNEYYGTCNQKTTDEEKSIASERKTPTNQRSLKSAPREKKIDDLPINTFPLRSGQLGYMNIALQKFLGFNNQQICYNSNIDKKLKKDTHCIVRIGVEKNKNQSFLCLLAYVYKKFDRITNIPILTSKVESLEEFKNAFIENLTIDKFVISRNGDLVKIFQTDEIPEEDIDVSIYNSIYLNNVDNPEIIKRTVNAYNNFKTYFMDDSTEIDYTYIWDFVTKPIDSGGILFENGINLLILRSPSDDIIDKIELICPTNHNSQDIFDYRKKTLMCYTNNNYFEPLCKIKRTTRKGDFRVSAFFSAEDFNSFTEVSNINNTIAKIKENYIKSCFSKNINENYKYLRNKNMNEYIPILNELGFRIIRQLINYNNQVIGLIIQQNEPFYLPILPSAINFDIEFELVNTFDRYNTYEKTKDNLLTLYNLSNKQILSKPVKKVVDNNMIVGIITHTNQFVPITPEQI